MVTQDTIQQVRIALAKSSAKGLESEFANFFKDQPALTDFVMELTSTSRQSVSQLSLFMSYVVYKSVLLEAGGSLEEITGDRIAHASHKSEDWVHEMSQSQAWTLPASALSEVSEELPLISYVISEIHEADIDGLNLEEEEKGAVFFVLTSVIASLTKQSDP